MDSTKQSATIEAEPIYTSACANGHENNISCRKNYLLYSRSHCPVVQDLTTTRLTPTFLFGHKGVVNGQCFVDSLEPSDESSGCYFISTSHDKSAIIWQVTYTEDSKISHRILHSFASPNQEVFTTRCSLHSKDGFISITTTIDGSLHLWRDQDLLQTSVTSYCCLNSKLLTIKVDEQGTKFVLLFLASSDNKVHVFQLVDNLSKLEHRFDLTGHTDWIKYLEILELPDRRMEYLLASASQDSHIRVWHLKVVDYDIDARHVRTIVSDLDIADANSLQNKHKLTATLETVLSGHEGIVHGLCWFKGQSELALELISCSSDKTIIHWSSSIAEIDPSRSSEPQQLNKYEQCPASAEVWKETHRLGETGETNLPFLGVCLSQDNSTFYAQSLHGAIHSWHWNQEEKSWSARPAVMGHFGSVTDLSWEKSGAYLLSSSLDKTCRLHAIANIDSNWHELARPLVHGHEVNCLVSLDFIKFACGAEEKTIRAFEATKFFAKSFKNLAKAGVPDELEPTIQALPVHAQLPALGLSNRGALCPYDIGDPSDKTSTNNSWYSTSKMVVELSQLEGLSTPPIEEILLQSTLWWETNKIFGHSNELHALATDSFGSYLASASKANRPDLANILVWDCSKFRKVATIEHHALTITRLRFSPSDRYLLSVSRDRTWCISERTGHVRSAYKKLCGTTKTNANHDRIIWDCCWTHDSKHFMTVSRDKKAILWSMETLEQAPGNELACTTSKLFDCSIQAVDSPDCSITSNSYMFALGFEDGSMKVCSVTLGADDQWQTLATLHSLHQFSIRRLALQPTCCKLKEGEHNSLLLASAGDDCVVKLTKLNLK